MSAMRRNIGAAALGEARLWLGTPYRHQASLRGVGCDCLGLLRGVWRGLYGAEPEPVPPYSGTWAESAAPGTDPLTEAALRHLAPVADPRVAVVLGAGDVLLFAFRRHLPARHCAIATGDGAMIHAHDGAVVAEVALTGWWRRHMTGVFRFPDGGADSVHEASVATVTYCRARWHGIRIATTPATTGSPTPHAARTVARKPATSPRNTSNCRARSPAEPST